MVFVQALLLRVAEVKLRVEVGLVTDVTQYFPFFISPRLEPFVVVLVADVVMEGVDLFEVLRFLSRFLGCRLVKLDVFLVRVLASLLGLAGVHVHQFEVSWCG